MTTRFGFEISEKKTFKIQIEIKAYTISEAVAFLTNLIKRSNVEAEVLWPETTNKRVI